MSYRVSGEIIYREIGPLQSLALSRIKYIMYILDHLEQWPLMSPRLGFDDKEVSLEKR